MTKDEALKLALWHEAMAREPNRNQAKREKHEATAKFIKEALAQSEQYPQIAINPEIVGYVAPQRKPLTDEQRFDLLTKFEPYKNKWGAPAILIDMVEAAHGIKDKNTQKTTRENNLSSD